MDDLLCPRCGEPTDGDPDPAAPEYATDLCPGCEGMDRPHEEVRP